MRPVSHVANNTASGDPESGKAPVQFGTAVSKKPATAAAANPKIISWACQANGELPNMAQLGAPSASHANHRPMAKTA